MMDMVGKICQNGRLQCVLDHGGSIFTKKNTALCLTLSLTTALFLLSYSETSVELSSGILATLPVDRESFKTVSPETLQPRNLTKILTWTRFFGSWRFFYEAKSSIQKDCPNLGCQLTRDKSELEDSDAVVFHMGDSILQGLYIDPVNWFTYPKYRSRNQVWVMYNLEPLPMLYGDVSGWNNLINWTWSYTLDADVSTPYGGFRKLSDSERSKIQKKLSGIDFYQENKIPGAVWIVGNCYDDARRYRVLRALNKYMPVKVYGRCGEPCPNGTYSGCSNAFMNHKFYLALENSDCKDYISEKFWRALERYQIPIVAWRFGPYFKRLVPPHSYINLYDFPDLDEAGKYVAEVNLNKTLFNSYFTWTKDYAISYSQNGWCKLCEKLKDKTVHHQSYDDLQGWFNADTCKTVTALSYGKRLLDRFLFDHNWS